MTITTTLGPRGYTILKSQLTDKEQKRIKKDLTVEPFSIRNQGNPFSDDDATFPVYRESPTRLFVPHYYGVAHFGPPQTCIVSAGQDIDLTFNGHLKDYQVPVMRKFMEHMVFQNTDSSFSRGGLLELYCGWGKTAATLYAISKLKKKTLVIVHKDFLMNQWTKRIQQFLPGARIGRIQGPTIDVKDKDIVLCMLQSLVQKDYDLTLFAQFGFTIIDEVHHISSQTFSKSLFKIVSRYMLGLSATMNRKDRTTDVFKMFLGDIIYSAEKKTDTTVEVRAIHYKVDDDEFNETILDYKGQPQNSSMISKICEYSARTEFIISVLTDFIGNKTPCNKLSSDMCKMCNKSEHFLIRNTCCDTVEYCLPCMQSIDGAVGKGKRPKCPSCAKVLKYQQNYVDDGRNKPLEQTHVIVMAHNLNILHYIYRKLVCYNLASVGYYIGGMKEDELKKSETKQVILATYSMSSEGLDIPSLNAEFLITPKTDIVQSVGRILRAKHAYMHPIIYDFVDSHDVFCRQWYKRRAFYKKSGFNILSTSSARYHANVEWTVAPKSEKKSAEVVEDTDDDNCNDINEVCLLNL